MRGTSSVHSWMIGLLFVLFLLFLVLWSEDYAQTEQQTDNISMYSWQKFNQTQNIQENSALLLVSVMVALVQCGQCSAWTIYNKVSFTLTYTHRQDRAGIALRPVLWMNWPWLGLSSTEPKWPQVFCSTLVGGALRLLQGFHASFHFWELFKWFSEKACNSQSRHIPFRSWNTETKRTEFFQRLYLSLHLDLDQLRWIPGSRRNIVRYIRHVSVSCDVSVHRSLQDLVFTNVVHVSPSHFNFFQPLWDVAWDVLDVIAKMAIKWQSMRLTQPPPKIGFL